MDSSSERKKDYKVYVDTNILSRIFVQKELDDEILSALEKICDHESINLVTSNITLEELLANKDLDELGRVSIKLLYKIFTKVSRENLINPIPVVVEDRYPVPEYKYAEYPCFLALKNIFDPMDAEHIFQAKRAKCDYFLTLDRKTILNRVSTHENELKTHPCYIDTRMFVNPVQLAALINI